MDSSLDDESIFFHSLHSDDFGAIFQTGSDHPYDQSDNGNDCFIIRKDPLKIDHPMDCLEVLNTTLSVEDFLWDSSDDALIENTIPNWLFPAQNIPTSASACSTAISTTTDSAIAAQMDTLLLPEKDNTNFCSTRKSLVSNADAENLFLQFSADSDHTSLDEERYHLLNNQLHDMNGIPAFHQPEVPIKQSWIHRSVPQDALAMGSNDDIHYGHQYYNSNNPINRHYDTNFAIHSQLYPPHLFDASSRIDKGHTTDTVPYQTVPSANAQQQHPYHTRKRKLHFPSPYSDNKNHQSSYHYHPKLMQLFSVKENADNGDDDSEDSHVRNTHSVSLTFAATNKTMNTRNKKAGSKVQNADNCENKWLESINREDDIFQSERQQDVLRQLQSMVDSITDPVGKYMRKRNLTPMDAVRFNLHGLLLQAPKKPRQRYGPRLKKLKTERLLDTATGDLEETSSRNDIDTEDNATTERDTQGNMRSYDSQPVHPPEDVENTVDLDDEFHEDCEDNEDTSQGATVFRNETTRARNREHARATRRRRRIFKEIDSFLQHCHNSAHHTVDPLFLRQSSH